MRILYTTNNLPLLETDSGEIYPFNYQNADIIVGELSLDIDSCNEIKNKVVETINEVINKKLVSSESTLNQINAYITSVSGLGEYMIVNQIVDSAMKTYKMITTPKPYDTWIWDANSEEYISPVPYPKKTIDSEPDKYYWSNDTMSWEPVEVQPYKSWNWDTNLEKYIPPIPYPIDADPEEFIWDEEKTIWVVNE